MAKEVPSALRWWPLFRQAGRDRYALADAAKSKHTRRTKARIAEADRIVDSICPYCAVGCGQKAYVKDEKIIQVEGDPDSPISRGRLCPKGAATRTMSQSPLRQYKCKYRRPYGTAWEEIDLDTAVDMIADRIIKTRNETWEETTPKGERVARTLGIASLGGATLDNEENYLMKKLYTALGIVQVENQARI
jgi:formate dehydrogenase major subunit